MYHPYKAILKSVFNVKIQKKTCSSLKSETFDFISWNLLIELTVLELFYTNHVK